MPTPAEVGEVLGFSDDVEDLRVHLVAFDKWMGIEFAEVSSEGNLLQRCQVLTPKKAHGLR